MAEPDKMPDDAKMDQTLGNLLRRECYWRPPSRRSAARSIWPSAGTSGAPTFTSSPTRTRRLPPSLSTVAGVVAYAFNGHGAGLIQLGVLLLIATPVARVAFSVYAFARQRDVLYVVVTVIVLALLLFSLFGSNLLP